MTDLRDRTHQAVVGTVREQPALESLLSRGDQRRLVREVSDWYLGGHTNQVTRNGSCVVVTAGPPGAGKSSLLPVAVPDLSTRLLIDPDVAKVYLATWCVRHGHYADLLASTLPDGRLVTPLELAPLLQTLSTEACNTVRRIALAAQMDVVVSSTMASSAFGERLLLSLAKADYDRLQIVSIEVDRATAHQRVIDRWWEGRNQDPATGGRLVLPETVDAAYGPDDSTSLCRLNARTLVSTIRSGGTVIESVTIAEYDGGTLSRLDADPPRGIRP